MASKTIRLTDDQDIAIEDGRAHFLTGGEARAQNARSRLSTVRGEWFVALKTLGLPLFDEILVHNPEIALIELLIVQEIEATPGFIQVQTIDLTTDPNDSRKLRVTFSAETVEGRVTVSQLKMR